MTRSPQKAQSALHTNALVKTQINEAISRMVCRSGIGPHLCSAVSLEFHRVDLVEADDARRVVDEDEGLGTKDPRNEQFARSKYATLFVILDGWIQRIFHTDQPSVLSIFPVPCSEGTDVPRWHRAHT